MVGESRKFLDYRDIDNTIEPFLVHFQQKYLYGIPFNVITNKRMLLKHVLDVYRSKGSIQCYKLLFKLIYNQDCEIYLPGIDLLRVSDGTWNIPKYIEVSDNGNLQKFQGKKIVGISSNISAVVENVISEVVGKGIVHTFYLSNILPPNSEFIQNEKIVIENETSGTDVWNAPINLGSLEQISIINGGQDFYIGNILKISNMASGIDGLARVTNLSRQFGTISFKLQSGGIGYNSSANVFTYNDPTDTTGIGASFKTGALSYIKSVTYNTDIWSDYLYIPFNATSYGFPGNPSANSASPFSSFLSYKTENFGTIASLTNIKTGSNYTKPLNTFVRSLINSSNLVGTVSFSPASSTITGTTTTFLNHFSNGDAITLYSTPTTLETHIIKTVTSDTILTLFGPPKYANTVGNYQVAASIFKANFLPTDPLMATKDNSIGSQDCNVLSNISIGNNCIANVVIINSGKGYINNELVELYRYGSVTTPTIIGGGTGYSNGDTLIFSGGQTTSVANGYVTVAF